MPIVQKRWRCPRCGSHRRTDPQVGSTYHVECETWYDLIGLVRDDGAILHEETRGTIQVATMDTPDPRADLEDPDRTWN